METADQQEKPKKKRGVPGVRSPKTIAMQARLKEIVEKALRERRLMERTQRDETLTVDATVEQIRRGALFDPRDLFYTEDGQEHYLLDGPRRADGSREWSKGDVRRAWCRGDLKPMHALTEAQAQSITSIEIIMKNATAGDGQIDRILKIRLAPREKYVELAARHHGLLVDRLETNVNVTVVGSKLDEARQRYAALGYGDVLEAKALPEPESTEG